MSDDSGDVNDGVKFDFDFSTSAEPFQQDRKFHLTSAAKAFFLKPSAAIRCATVTCPQGGGVGTLALAHGSSTQCSAEGRGQTVATESEAEAEGPTDGEREEAAGPSNHGEGQNREMKICPLPNNCPKKITSSKLGAFLFEKFPGWDFDGKLFGANFNTDMFTKSLRENIDFENAVFASCSSHFAR